MITVIHLTLTDGKGSRVVAIFPQLYFSFYFLIPLDFTPTSSWRHFLIRWLLRQTDPGSVQESESEESEDTLFFDAFGGRC